MSEDQSMCQKEKWPKVKVHDCMHDAAVVIVAI